MPRTIRFHLDENCHRAVAEGLQRRGVDVTTTPDVGLLNATDDEQLAYCETQGKVLFTQDRDFLRLHAAGITHPGIVYLLRHGYAQHRRDDSGARVDLGDHGAGRNGESGRVLVTGGTPP